MALTFPLEAAALEAGPARARSGRALVSLIREHGVAGGTPALCPGVGEGSQPGPLHGTDRRTAGVRTDSRRFTWPESSLSPRGMCLEL